MIDFFLMANHDEISCGKFLPGTGRWRREAVTEGSEPSHPKHMHDR